MPNIELRSFDPVQPYATTRQRNLGDSITVDAHYANRNFVLDGPGLSHHLLCVVLNGSGRLMQRRGPSTHSTIIRPDDVIVVPAGQPNSWNGHTPHHVRFRLTESHLTEAWQHLGTLPSRPVELLPIFSEQDQFLSRMARLLDLELAQPEHPAQRLILESASAMIAAHLVRRHSALGAKPQRLVRISPVSLKRITDYIEDNLSLPIALADLARLAGLSPFHFCRSFRETTGITPMRFVEQSRIRRAETLIRSGFRSLKGVGLAVGYKDQSHFTRRFASQTKCTPAEFARLIASAKFSANTEND